MLTSVCLPNGTMNNSESLEGLTLTRLSGFFFFFVFSFLSWELQGREKRKHDSLLPLWIAIRMFKNSSQSKLLEIHMCPILLFLSQLTFTTSCIQILDVKQGPINGFMSGPSFSLLLPPAKDVLILWLDWPKLQAHRKKTAQNDLVEVKYCQESYGGGQSLYSSLRSPILILKSDINWLNNIR